MGVLLALFVSVVPASASARHEADRLGAQARADRLAGAYRPALGEASRAYKLFPRPLFLFEMAEDHRGLGEWADALAYYERFLATRPAGGNRAIAKKHLAEAKSHTRSSAVDVLAVAPLAPSPLTAAPLAAAPPASAAPAPNSLEVAPLAPPPVVEAPAAPPAPPAAVASAPPAGPEGEVAQEAPAHHSRWLAYTLIGLAGASAVVAVVGWANVASYNGYVGSIQQGPPKQTQAVAAKNAQSQAGTWQGAAIATTVVAALAGGSVAFAW
ncbi:MAG: tetratricopeptide repeat protein [Myxococcales bacterium]